jgi:hypothetical protein
MEASPVPSAPIWSNSLSTDRSKAQFLHFCFKKSSTPSGYLRRRLTTAMLSAFFFSRAEPRRGVAG